MATVKEAHALIGVQIPSSKLFTTRNVAVCSHHDQVQTEGGHKFCSICGKELWKKEYVPIAAFSDSELAYLRSENGNSIPLVKHKRYSRRDAAMGNDPADVCWFIAANPFHAQTGLGRSRIEDIRGLRQDIDDEVRIGVLKAGLQDMLEPLGLWEGSRFGLYAVLVEDIYIERD